MHACTCRRDWYPSSMVYIMYAASAAHLACICCVLQEGIDAISDVIYHVETFDVTTIRASTPMFLMSRKIKAMGVKMVLSGEGSDEVFGGYLYFHKATSKVWHQVAS